MQVSMNSLIDGIAQQTLDIKPASPSETSTDFMSLMRGPEPTEVKETEEVEAETVEGSEEEETRVEPEATTQASTENDTEQDVDSDGHENELEMPVQEIDELLNTFFAVQDENIEGVRVVEAGIVQETSDDVSEVLVKEGVASIFQKTLSSGNQQVLQQVEGAEVDLAVPVSQMRLEPTPVVVPNVSSSEAAPTQALSMNETVVIEAAATLETLSDHTIRAVRIISTEEGGVIKIRMVPESLGEIRLEVSVSGKSTEIHFVSNSPIVREALESQFELLRQSLREEGIEVSEFSVSTGPNSESESVEKFLNPDSSERADSEAVDDEKSGDPVGVDGRLLDNSNGVTGNLDLFA